MSRTWTVDEIRAELAQATTAQDLPRELFTDDEALGPCPCFWIEQPGFEVAGHCWRCGCDDHPYSARKSDGRCCVHVTGPADMAERLRDLLDEMHWYGGWALELWAPA